MDEWEAVVDRYSTRFAEPEEALYILDSIAHQFAQCYGNAQAARAALSPSMRIHVPPLDEPVPAVIAGQLAVLADLCAPYESARQLDLLRVVDRQIPRRDTRGWFREWDLLSNALPRTIARMKRFRGHKGRSPEPEEVEKLLGRYLDRFSGYATKGGHSTRSPGQRDGSKKTFS